MNIFLIETNTNQNITLSGHRVNYSTTTATLTKIISGLTFNRKRLLILAQ